MKTRCMVWKLAGPVHVSNLFFADDSLIFAKTNYQKSLKLFKILNCYKEVSSQKVDFKISEASFSEGIDLGQLADMLGLKSVDKHARYLRRRP